MYENLNKKRQDLFKRDQKLKAQHEDAVKEFENLNREQQKVLLKEKEASKAYEMLLNAFKVMEEEKEGVLNVNTEANKTFKSYQEEHTNLNRKKDDIMRKDKSLAEKYNENFQQLKKLEDVRKALQTKMAQLDWETCLLNNSV